MQQLISIGQILDKTIDHYAKHFKTIMQFSLWFLIVTLFMIIAGFMMPVTETLNVSTINVIGYVLMILTGLIITPIVSVWVFMSLVQVTNDQYLGKKVDNKVVAKMTWKKFIPYAWVAILRSLVLMIPFVAVLPGLLLIVANIYFDGGIWFGALSILLTFVGALVGVIFLIILSVQLGFVGFTMLLEDQRGTKALKASRALVKGRFWHVLVRLLVPKIVFTAAIVIFQFLAIAITAPLAGLAVTNIAAAAHIADIVNNLISGGITILSVPLFIIADYLIYDSLRKTYTKKPAA